METRQTIITSFLTTLATIFVVAVIMHMCCGHCGGKSSCSKQSSHCEKSMSSCGSDSSCKEKCCADKSKCDMEKGCSKDSKMCKMDGKTCTMKDGKEMVMEKEIVVKEEVKK